MVPPCGGFLSVYAMRTESAVDANELFEMIREPDLKRFEAWLRELPDEDRQEIGELIERRLSARTRGCLMRRPIDPGD